MPLKCKACGQCHTARRGCADVYATLERMAGPMPEPKDTPGEWVLECGKHHRPYRACCEGRYTLKWRWKDTDPTPPPVETDAGRAEQHEWLRRYREARPLVEVIRQGPVTPYLRGEWGRAIEQGFDALLIAAEKRGAEDALSRLATIEAENGRQGKALRLINSFTCCPEELKELSAGELRDLIQRVNDHACAALETPPHD